MTLSQGTVEVVADNREYPLIPSKRRNPWMRVSRLSPGQVRQASPRKIGNPSRAEASKPS